MSPPDRGDPDLEPTALTVVGSAVSRPTVAAWSVPEHDAGEDAEAKRRRKEQKLREQADHPLDPFTRYKALIDSLKEEQDIVEMADKKARFALVIMSALNAGILIIASRAPLQVSLRGGILGSAAIGLLAVYAACALYFFVQAIEALRPRAGGLPPIGPLVPGQPANVRFYRAVHARPLAEYQRVWNELRIDQLNAELAAQMHVVAGIAIQKYAALTRLYVGLKLMTGLVAVILLDLALAAWLH